MITPGFRQSSATARRGRPASQLDIGAQGSIGFYTAERSVVDVIRLRHNEGADVAWEALRRWLRRRGNEPAMLIKMAEHFHGAERAVRSALEIVM